jgi:hypothetical protein
MLAVVSTRLPRASGLLVLTLMLGTAPALGQLRASGLGAHTHALFHPVDNYRTLSTMTQMGVESRVMRGWVIGGVATAVVATLVGAVLLTGPDEQPLPPQAQLDEMGRLCVEAGQAKLPVLITQQWSKPTFKQIDGTDWQVRVTLNHKTKWLDNLHDVTCVVAWTSPTVTVKSVETAAR